MLNYEKLTIFERIKYIRKNELKITQKDFASSIGLSRSNIGSIETGRINVTDRVIQDICLKYNVNENWLRNGTGEMFIKTKKSLLDELAVAHNINEKEKAIIQSFLDLSPQGRAGVLEYVENLVNTYTKQEETNDTPIMRLPLVGRDGTNTVHTLTGEEARKAQKFIEENYPELK